MTQELDISVNPLPIGILDEVRLRDAAMQGLQRLMYCTRAQSAWSAGTMTQADFHQADESDECIDQVVEAVKQLYATPKIQPENSPRPPVVTWGPHNVQYMAADEVDVYVRAKVGYQRDVSFQYMVSQHDTIEALRVRAETAERLAKEHNAVAANSSLSPDSALAILAKALLDITQIEDEMFGSDWQEIECARSIAQAALGQTGLLSADASSSS